MYSVLNGTQKLHLLHLSLVIMDLRSTVVLMKYTHQYYVLRIVMPVLHIRRETRNRARK